MRRRALLSASGGGADYTPIDYVTFDGSTIFDTGGIWQQYADHRGEVPTH